MNAEKTNQEKAWQAFLKKIDALLEEGETYETIANRIGTAKNVVWEWKNKGKGGKRVAFDVMRRYLEGVGLDPSDFFGAAESTQNSWMQATGLGGVPLIGLAACSLEGWYNKTQMAMKVPRFGDQGQNPDVFAVIAIGASMQPMGILQGFICYCDPRSSLEVGDIVFVERADGTASIKQYLGTKRTRTEKGFDDWVVLQGWLDPAPDGSQRSYTSQELAVTVKKMAPVTYIKRKM